MTSTGPAGEPPDEVASEWPHRLVLVPFGVPARSVLQELVGEANRTDPLTPVTVVVPSAHAGVTLRRSLAAEHGLVNVQFVSLPQLGEALAAPLLAAELRRPLAPSVELAAIRAILEDSPGALGGAIPNATTAQSLAATFHELRDLPPAALDRLAAAGPRGREVVQLYRALRDRCVEFADTRDTLATAVTAVRSGAASVAALGTILVYLPRRLGHLEVELIGALARRERLTVVLGTAGALPQDPSLDALVGRLEPALGAARVVDEHAADDARRAVVRAPDPDEEVRVAVRHIIESLRGGVRPDRIAVVARLADPYFALVHEQLSAAGITHHGPSGLRLDQTVAGRTLLRGLDVLRDDLPRVDLLNWLRAAPFRQPDGWPLPVDSFERIAREAGIAGGRAQWGERLAEASDELDDRLARLLPAYQVDGVESTQPVREAPAGLPEPPETAAAPTGKARRLGRRARHLQTLQDVIAWLVAMDDERAGLSGWGAHAAWARRFLEALLGDADRFQPDHPDIDDGWLAGEASAYRQLLDGLEGLGALDEVHERCDADAFRDVLATELEQPAMRVGVLGQGVFVGGVADAVGADHDLVVVLGMAEGIFPPRGQDDPILPDYQRAAVGDLMPPRKPSRHDEWRDHAAVVASSRHVVLSFARTDTSAQRERLPSRWLLAEVQRLLGGDGAPPLSADNLDDLDRFDGFDAAAGAWWVDIPSFAWRVEHDDAAAMTTAAEATAAAMARRRSVGDEPAVVAPGDRPALLRALAASAERQAGAFGAYTGHVGPHAALAFDELRVGSATSFETWAVCPFRYFVRHVLDVRGLDERADSDEISAMDRGSYTHRVLEEFVGARLSGEPGEPGDVEPFSAAELERLRAVARDVGEQFRVEGRTGRPLLWSLRSEQLLRRLEQIFLADREHREVRGVEPVAVELAFGARSAPDAKGETVDSSDRGERTDLVPPVVIRLDGDRPLAFRGFVDRVDRSREGDRLVVIDYKTGKDGGYEELHPRTGPKDIVCRGRHLQLALYALAAQSRFGDLPVSAYFWFVEKPSRTAFLGGEIDALALARLQEVLGIVVDGIEQGQFPSRPGDDGYFGWSNCGFCDFDRICPTSRGDLWEAVRAAPELHDYRELAEGPLPEPADSVP